MRGRDLRHTLKLLCSGQQIVLGLSHNSPPLARQSFFATTLSELQRYLVYKHDYNLSALRCRRFPFRYCSAADFIRGSGPVRRSFVFVGMPDSVGARCPVADSHRASIKPPMATTLAITPALAGAAPERSYTLPGCGSFDGARRS
jgi:hypothetical protein